MGLNGWLFWPAAAFTKLTGIACKATASSLYNSNLHLLLGVHSVLPLSGKEGILGKWGVDMVSGTNGTPMTIHDAWYAAARLGYSATGFNYGSVPIVFAVAGDVACLADTIQTNSPPVGTFHYDKQPVWP